MEGWLTETFAGETVENTRDGPLKVSNGKPSKRGRKASKMDVKAKLERSRQSARECRARKKLRYQYLEELVSNREKAVIALRNELEKYRKWAPELDEGRVPPEVERMLTEDDDRFEETSDEEKDDQGLTIDKG